MTEKAPEIGLDYGRVIEALRRQRGMTQEALASAAGVSASYLSEVERGFKRPSTDVLAKLAKAFGMLPSQLLEFVESFAAVPAQSVDSLVPPKSRREWASAANRLGQEGEGTRSASKDQALKSLLFAAQHLAEDDLRTLLDLALHMLKKSK